MPTIRVKIRIGEHLRSVHNWGEFAIGDCSELERCQIRDSRKSNSFLKTKPVHLMPSQIVDHDDEVKIM